MKRKIAVLCLFVLCISFFTTIIPTGVLAEDDITSLRTQLKELEKQQNSMEKQLKDIKSQKNKSIETKNKLESQIDNLNAQIKKLDELLAAVNKKLKDSEAALDTVNADLENYTEEYAKRLRYSYETPKISYIEVLFNSKDFSDFLNKLELVQQVMEYDSQLIEQMREKRNDAQELKDEIAEQKRINDETNAKLDSQKSTLSKKQEETQDTINSLENNQAEIQKLIKEIEKNERELTEQIAAKLDATMVYAGGQLAPPVAGHYGVSSLFGWRMGPTTKVREMHYGLDISGGINGKPALAANSGKVIIASYGKLNGNYVAIDHGGKITTQYMHLSSYIVKAGQDVERGQVIGYVGSTGNSTGPHLHFEVSENGVRKDPLDYLPNIYYLLSDPKKTLLR